MDFKAFRDRENGLIITYWVMDKDEEFFSCDVSYLPCLENGLVLDMGCNFITKGSFTYQEAGSSTITTGIAPYFSNYRPPKPNKVTALEDDTRWCYALSLDAIELEKEKLPISQWGRTITGEHISVSSSSLNYIKNNDKQDIFIVNPLFKSEPETIEYKKNEDDEFVDLTYGKYLKIEDGETVILRSKVDVSIPKVYYYNF